MSYASTSTLWDFIIVFILFLRAYTHNLHVHCDTSNLLFAEWSAA